MKRVLNTALPRLTLAVLLAISFVATGRDSLPQTIGVALPAFSQTSADAWINSPPLDVDALRGYVVLIDFWTFECWNCYRSFPWLNQLESYFSDKPFRVIGIHSPQFERERDPASVRQKVAEFALKHPVMLDRDLAFWRAMGNRYWPAYYLVDKRGLVRHAFVGETHAGDAQSQRVQSAIAALLAE